ncbi:MAG: flagellar type III secretion system pore protein FliP [Gammaproteobacteria bacterium]|nr:flagellar type III secretion system pore protein FliP [Gammaproteobacteria bacterium]MDH5693330.1 flagellar type III secretion system pore protein FliP [Gammaproteobacteria bacterium]
MSGRPIKAWSVLLTLGLMLLPFTSFAADPGIPAVSVASDEKGGTVYTLSLQIIALMTMLTLLPAGLMMLTAFTRIIIVLAILRQAIGLMQAPSSQVLIGLALFLTFFIMAPVFDRIFDDAVKPYVAEEIELGVALDRAQGPLRQFMMGQTRETDLSMFAEISGNKDLESADAVPFSLLIPAFITSELKTAFQIGFLLYIPFLVIDLVVASVLMAMGMMMLSPMMISLPFKIMLFVLVDGWSLIMGTLASSFFV